VDVDEADADKTTAQCGSGATCTLTMLGESHDIEGTSLDEPTTEPIDNESDTSNPAEPTTPNDSEPWTQHPFYFGDEFITNTEMGIEVSRGLSVRLIATSKETVKYADGTESDLKYHAKSDGAGIIPLNPDDPTNGGYVYVANAEKNSGSAGVYGIYFDKDGNVMDYKALLTGTTKNCGGGLSPWHTFLSCEEYRDVDLNGEFISGGQCWQIDPNPESEYHDNPQATKLGGDKGGQYESVAVDNSNPEKPVFFVTEDFEFGAMRRFLANGSGWEALHSDGDTTFLRMFDDGTYEWTKNETAARESGNKHYMNSEGISYHEGKIYFMAKKKQKMIVLDLENLTYEEEFSGMKFYGEGSFDDQPDQILHGARRKYIYFCEDGGPNPGVYARHDNDGTYFTLFQGIKGVHPNDETIGIALSPDSRRLIAGIQDAGLIMEFTRDDGLPFE